MTASSEARRIYQEWANIEREQLRPVQSLEARQCVEGLQREMKVVLSLLYVEGMTCEEIANALNTSVESIVKLKGLAIQELQSTS